MRLLLWTLVLENVSRRRVLRRRLRRRRLRGPPPERCSWGLHGRGMSSEAGVPGRRRTRLRTRAGEFHHARVPQGAGRRLKTRSDAINRSCPKAQVVQMACPSHELAKVIVARSDASEL